MPTPPYAQATTSVNAGAYTPGGVVVPSLATVAFQMASTVGVTSQLWELYSYPDGWTAPAGWTLSGGAGSSYTSNAVVPPSLTLPANTTSMWGKWMVRLTINGGVSATSPNLLIDETCAFSMLSNNGLEDSAYNEATQFSVLKQWSHGIQVSLRILNSLVTAAASGFAVYAQSCAAGGTIASTAPANLVQGVSLTGAPAAAFTYKMPATNFVGFVMNNTGKTATITSSGGAGRSVAIPAGGSSICWCVNGVDVFGTLTSGAAPIATAVSGNFNIASPSGYNVFYVTSASAITGTVTGTPQDGCIVEVFDVSQNWVTWNFTFASQAGGVIRNPWNSGVADAATCKLGGIGDQVNGQSAKWKWDAGDSKWLSC